MSTHGDAWLRAAGDRAQDEDRAVVRRRSTSGTAGTATAPSRSAPSCSTPYRGGTVRAFSSSKSEFRDERRFYDYQFYKNATPHAEAIVNQARDPWIKGLYSDFKLNYDKFKDEGTPRFLPTDDDKRGLYNRNMNINVDIVSSP